MSDGANKAALAVAHIFHIHDVEWSDRLIESLARCRHGGISH